MVDEKIFKERAARLLEIGKVLETLPAEVRALAYPMLSSYALTGTEDHGDINKKGKSDGSGQSPTPPPPDREGFFNAFDHEKPADNAKLLAGWFYREYGTEPFSVDDVKQLANEVGVTIPERLDMTLAQAKENSKKLFARAGRGKFKPTVHGETYLKTTYSIAKGTKRRPAQTE